MLDRSHPTNKHDVEIARIRRDTLIAVAAIPALAALVLPLLAFFHSTG